MRVAGEASDLVLVRLAPALHSPTLSGISTRLEAPPARAARAAHATPVVRWDAGTDGNTLAGFGIASPGDANRGAIPQPDSVRRWVTESVESDGIKLGAMNVAGWYSLDGNGQHYRIKPGSRPMKLIGAAPTSSSLSFNVTVPSWNLAGRCGARQPKFACLWATSDGRARYRICNGPTQRAGPRSVLIPIAPGAFSVSIASDEADGCGWPDGTDQFVVSDVRIEPRRGNNH